MKIFENTRKSKSEQIPIGHALLSISTRITFTQSSQKMMLGLMKFGSSFEEISLWNLVSQENTKFLVAEKERDFKKMELI